MPPAGSVVACAVAAAATAATTLAPSAQRPTPVPPPPPLRGVTLLTAAEVDAELSLLASTRHQLSVPGWVPPFIFYVLGAEPSVATGSIIATRVAVDVTRADVGRLGAAAFTSGFAAAMARQLRVDSARVPAGHVKVSYPASTRHPLPLGGASVRFEVCAAASCTWCETIPCGTDEGGSSLAVWMVVIIVVACVAALAAVIAVVCCCCRRKDAAELPHSPSPRASPGRQSPGQRGECADPSPADLPAPSQQPSRQRTSGAAAAAAEQAAAPPNPLDRGLDGAAAEHANPGEMEENTEIYPPSAENPPFDPASDGWANAEYSYERTATAEYGYEHDGHCPSFNRSIVAG